MDEFQHIARLGDMGKIDLGLDSIFGGRRPRGLGGTLRLGSGGLEISPHCFGFVVFERTGMGFLFRDANQWQHVQYGFALNFQFPGQIVDSNLTHSPSLFLVSAMLSSSTSRPELNRLEPPAIPGAPKGFLRRPPLVRRHLPRAEQLVRQR